MKCPKWLRRPERWTRWKTAIGSLTVLAISSATLAWAESSVDFSEQIKPILSDRCYLCHGPDAETRRADLRLDRRDEAIRKTDLGSVPDIIKPGSAEESELYLRISSHDPFMRMPPSDSNLELSDEEIQLIRRWINEGASWDEHWSFRRLDAVAPPAVASDWVRNPIDQFVLHRMAAADLKPASPAARQALIRRVYFDLTGLPPTPHEVDRFVAAPQMDVAYERVVDRLLQSPRFGERMASDWLDVARYSDTYGYQVDRDRFVWPWRDWVIDAFNKNLPYDRFVTQQLAGDLLPAATRDQILATTFNRLHPQKVEGGSTPEEFRVEYVADRTETFATAFLGLTFKCARCHDHKYDPFTQKEYYQLSAFFDKIDEAGLYSYFTKSVPTPTLTLEDEETRAKLMAAKARVDVAEQKLESLRTTRREAFEEWLQHRGQEIPEAVVPGRIALADFEQSAPGANQLVAGKVGKAIQLTGDDRVELDVGNFARNQPFSIALWMRSPELQQRAVVFHRSRAWTDAASRGYELLIEQGRLSAALVHFWPGNAIRLRTTHPIDVDQWKHVVVTYDGSSRARGLRIYVDGQRAPVEVVRDKLTKNITGGGFDNLMIGERFRDRGFKDGLVDQFQVFARRLTTAEAQHLYDGQTLHTLYAKPAAELDESDRRRLFEWFLATVDPDYAAARRELQAARARHNEIADTIPEIMVMDPQDGQRQTYFLKRGAYDQRGEPVQADTPEVFHRFADDQPRNRLGLARWLVDTENPLTARVAVNRYWQLLFGNGLVRTPEDFGNQGKPPTHPRLLDWLAYEFMANDWDVKWMLKQMVMSATYRQSTQGSRRARRIDPENRLLSYRSSFRLPAEMLRDNALFVGGLLVDKIGGPPAKPYELAASFKPSKPDPKDGVYRRSVYTYWKRTGPAPVMMTLDAAKRDVCRVRRERTSTPLQALVLLNGPQFVESARALAQRLLRQYDSDQEKMLSEMFCWLTSRRPDRIQRQVLSELHAKQLAYFRMNPAARDAFLRVGRLAVEPELDPTQLAAAAAVANSLMNYDRALTTP